MGSLAVMSMRKTRRDGGQTDLVLNPVGNVSNEVVKYGNACTCDGVEWYSAGDNHGAEGGEGHVSPPPVCRFFCYPLNALLTCAEDIKLKALYNPRLARLRQCNIVPPWDEYSELWPGTVVLMKITLHMYSMNNENRQLRKVCLPATDLRNDKTTALFCAPVASTLALLGYSAHVDSVSQCLWLCHRWRIPARRRPNRFS